MTFMQCSYVNYACMKIWRTHVSIAADLWCVHAAPGLGLDMHSV